MALRNAARSRRRRPDLDQGRPVDPRLAHPARQLADRRGGPVGRGRAVRRAAAGDRRGPARQDHDAGVLVEGRHRLAAARRHRQSVGPHARRPADPAAAARRRSASAWGRGRSARTAAARCASPPAFTGTVALKPTYGLIPLYPPSPFGTLSHAGPMTRTVRGRRRADGRDHAASTRATGRPCRRRRRRSPTASTTGSPGCGSATRPTSASSATTPRSTAPCAPPSTCSPTLGREVDEVDPGFADPVQAFHVLWFAGEAKVLQAYGDTLDALADRVDPGLRRTAATGRDVFGVGLSRRDRGADGAGPADGAVPRDLRRAGHPDAAAARVPGRQGRAGRLALAATGRAGRRTPTRSI